MLWNLENLKTPNKWNKELLQSLGIFINSVSTHWKVGYIFKKNLELGSKMENWRRRLWTAPYYWLYELHMFWFMPAFVESDFFAGVSMVLLMFCFFAKLSRAVEWCHSVFLIFFSQFIKSQNIAKHSTAAPCALLAAVFSLLDWHQLTRAGLRSKLVFILSFSTEKLCSDLRHFEITTSNNLFEIVWDPSILCRLW